MSLIFHIGHPKTGTSYIQNYLALNHEALRRIGCFYPVDFKEYGYHDYHEIAVSGRECAGNASALFHALQSGEYAWIKEWLGNVADLDVILSSELFFYYPHLISKVVDIFRGCGHKVVILAFIPNIERGVIAGYLQNVRNHGFYRDIFTFLERTRGLGYFRFSTIMKNIEEQCKPDSLVFIPYLKNGVAGSGIINDFFNYSKLGNIDTADFIDPVQVNKSLCAEVYEVMRLVNSCRGVPGYEEKMDLLRSVSCDGVDSFEYYFTSEIKGHINKHFGDEIVEMEVRMLSDVDRDAVQYWSRGNKIVESGLVYSVINELIGFFGTKELGEYDV